jgi:two-component system sensor histidine kinase/response regulator
MIRLSAPASDSLELLDDSALPTPQSLTHPAWKMLIVDDDVEIHTVTRYALTDYRFQEREVVIESVHSAREARELLPTMPDVAVILLDIVMETKDAGLLLVEYIRNTLNNQYVRIILRTGQPGESPEFQVIQEYDINDYKSKSELTNTKLLTAVTAAFRSYADIIEIDSYRKDLEGIVQERTKQLRAQNEALQALNTEKNEFLGIAAHDLKNPLSGIRGLAEMLLYSASELDAQEHQEFLTQILTASERMFELVTNLLDVNAFEQEGITLSIVSVDAVSIIRMIVEIYNSRAKAKNISIHFAAPSEALLRADELALQQVMENIISNAVKYSPHGKNVFVKIAIIEPGTSSTETSTEPHQTVQISVQDEGPGLSDDDKSKLFGKFARLSARPTGGEHSTGLGLSIVKKMVEAMNGNVWCESELGQGACFIVELPRG